MRDCTVRVAKTKAPLFLPKHFVGFLMQWFMLGLFRCTCIHKTLGLMFVFCCVSSLLTEVHYPRSLSDGMKHV